MTYTTKKGYGLKVIFITIVFVLILSLIVPCFKNYSAVAATSSGPEYFTGYSGDEISEEKLHELTRLNSASDDLPSITFLVHGQGGDASHWSNDEKTKHRSDDEAFNFAYDANSMIENLRRLAGEANVLWAQMGSNKNFYLSTLDRGFYNTDHSTYDYWTKIKDISKHTIVVFESADPYSYHRNVYEELHTVIDKISYDYLYLTGKIPTVNLISHSRGGITSMMFATGYTKDGKLANVHYSDKYASGYIDIGDGYYEIPAEYNQESPIIHDHPYNVAELYSMGSPYHGTDWDKEILWGVSHSLLGGSFANESAKNILDETIQSEIHNCWEEAVDKNPNLRLNAIAGTFNLSFVLGLLSEDYESLNSYLSASTLNTYLNILDR